MVSKGWPASWLTGMLQYTINVQVLATHMHVVNTSSFICLQLRLSIPIHWKTKYIQHTFSTIDYSINTSNADFFTAYYFNIVVNTTNI